jgi:bifunctional non-homologous end joining protein LigD
LAGAKPGKLPAFVAPCLATLVEEAPVGDRWVHEIKFDGYRLQARIDGDEVRLLTRGGSDWTGRFGSVAKALRSLKLDTAVIDGEVVVEDDSGVSSFVKLVEALKAGRSARMVYYAFDLLYLDGASLMGAALLDRKALLKKAIRGASNAGSIRYSEHFEVDGAVMLREACRRGLEGIISKRTDRPYRSGRRDDWLKTKCKHDDEFVIGGYLESKVEPRAVGALVVGYFERGALIYAGRVGTGFDRRAASELWKQLKPLRRASSAFAASLTSLQRRDVFWVAPRLVAQVEYRAWTGDNLLRHASFKGLREDKPAGDVHRPRVKTVRKPPWMP